MANKQKLELTWIGKENRPRLEPCILLEDPEKSYHAKYRVKRSNPQMTQMGADKRDNLRKSAQSADKSSIGVGDIFNNRLIFGDNLLALKALEQVFV